jgi:hypothetical protein
MTDCERCGDSLVDPRDKNAAGWWRDCCLPCIQERAPDVGRPRRDAATWLAETDAPSGWDDE